MKKTALLLIAILAISFAKAQTPTFCEVVNKILILGNKDKIIELKGDKVDRKMLFAQQYYKSTLALPGFTDPEVKERYHAGCWFSAHILYDNETDMMNTYKTTQQQIQDCLTATHQKFEFTDNGPDYDVWWQYKKVKLTLHHYVSGKIYVVDLSFEPPY